MRFRDLPKYSSFCLYDAIGKGVKEWFSLVINVNYRKLLLPGLKSYLANVRVANFELQIDLSY